MKDQMIAKYDDLKNQMNAKYDGSGNQLAIEHDGLKNQETADDDSENRMNAENGDSVGKLSHKRTKKNQLEDMNLGQIIELNCEKLQIMSLTIQRGVIQETVVKKHRIFIPAAVVNEAWR